MRATRAKIDDINRKFSNLTEKYKLYMSFSRRVTVLAKMTALLSVVCPADPHRSTAPVPLCRSA
jgi:hypothetical protein